MDPGNQLHLALDGRTVPLYIRRRSSEPSAHTGRDLVELHGWVTTADAEQSDWLTRTLRGIDEQSVRAQDAAGEFAGKWQLSWNSYAESAGLHTYTLILREHEELTLDTLLVAGEELRPYEYREEVLGDGITICAKMVGSDEDVARLRELLRAGGTFPVVRRGIQDQPREMWLGVGEWSPYEDQVKVRLTLLEAGVRASDHPFLAQVERENSQAALGFYMNFAERLVEHLVGRGILSAEEVETIREAASAQPLAARHDLWRVQTDIDAR